MSDDIKFSTDVDTSRVVIHEHRGLTAWLLRKGVAKNEQQAQYVLIGIAALAFTIAWYVWPVTPAPKEAPTLTLPPVDTRSR